jgi:flavin reductase (DIM6/NTAB) family NADH-FMN oxidoreductase RutF
MISGYVIFVPKIEVKPTEGLLSLPGFPVILVCIRKNILTVAAFSFFSFNPPMIMIGIVPNRYSFSLINEMEKKDFSVNIPEVSQLDHVKFCGSKSGKDVDKFKETGLTPQKASKISSYLIKECPISLECEVVHTIELERATHVWFVGSIVTAYKREDYNRSKPFLYWPREYRKIGKVIRE